MPPPATVVKMFPPATVVKISLASGSQHNLICKDTTTTPVATSQSSFKQQDTSTKQEILRQLGPKVYQFGDQTAIAESLQAGTLQGASVGSIKDGRGTCAWRIEPKEANKFSGNCIYGSAPIYRDPKTRNSTRAERGGFIGPLYYAWEILQKYIIKNGKITMNVDKISSYTKGDTQKKVGGRPMSPHGGLRFKTTKAHVRRGISRVWYKHRMAAC